MRLETKEETQGMVFIWVDFTLLAKPLLGWDIPCATLGLLSFPGGGLLKVRQWQPELRILPASAILPRQGY